MICYDPETKLKCAVFLFKNSLGAEDIYRKCALLFTITIINIVQLYSICTI